MNYCLLDVVLVNIYRTITNLSRVEICDSLRQFLRRVNLCNAVNREFSVSKKLKELRYQLRSNK